MFEGPIQRLIDAFGKLPGVGPKSAQRVAFYVINEDNTYADELIEAISEVKESVRFCEICGNVTMSNICSICANPRRDASLICVVEDPKDVIAIEKTREFRGKYHVLGGAINPLVGITPEKLRIRQLVSRITDGDKTQQINGTDPTKITEVILALNPNIEGEATGAYLAKLITDIGVKVTRLASGLPVGGDLEFADEVTLAKALAARLEI